MLSSDSSAPEMSQTSVKSHLLHTLQILTEDTVQQVRVLVGGLSILNILGSVQEPKWDFELLGVGNDRDNLRDFLLRKFTSSLVHVDVTLLANDVGESTTDTLMINLERLAKTISYLDRSQSEHNLLSTINVRIANTKDVLEVWCHHSDGHP